MIILLLCVLYLNPYLCVTAILFTLTADITSVKPRLNFRDNGQSVYSDYLSMPREQCRTLSVGLQVRQTQAQHPLQAAEI